MYICKGFVGSDYSGFVISDLLVKFLYVKSPAK